MTTPVFVYEIWLRTLDKDSYRFTFYWTSGDVDRNSVSVVQVTCNALSKAYIYETCCTKSFHLKFLKHKGLPFTGKVA